MRGRKTLFKEHMITEGEKLAELGFTHEEIADFWGISRRSLQRWLLKNPEFCHTLKTAKAKADKKVEDSLYKRAQGYEYEEKTYEKRGEELKLVKKVLKQIAPDTTAQIFWLKNRRPDLWRDRLEHAIGGSNELPPVKIIPVDGGPQQQSKISEQKNG